MRGLDPTGEAIGEVTVTQCVQLFAVRQPQPSILLII